LPKDNENIRLPLLGPVEPSEPQGFAPEQMIRCEECLRANPPTRINCLYCSVPLAVTESSARLRKPILRPTEKHELGYNTIVLPRADDFPASGISDAAAFLKLKEQDLERILAEHVPLPVARTPSREESQVIADRLQDLGLHIVTLRDEGVVTRVRSLSFDDSKLVINPGHAKNEAEVLWSQVILLVPGRVIQKRVEVKEIKTRRAENEILDTSELFSDEAVIDFYVSTHEQTWRILRMVSTSRVSKVRRRYSPTRTSCRCNVC